MRSLFPKIERDDQNPEDEHGLQIVLVEETVEELPQIIPDPKGRQE